ncbi:MAG: cytochrome c-type biogenesis protein CcmH, partial [Lentisphaeria bacterium]
MEFWQVFAAFSVMAAAFIVWPTIFVERKLKRDLLSNVRTETNEKVYQQHFEDLEQTRIRGEIEPSDFKKLKQDLEKTFIEENYNARDESERPIVSNFKSRIPVLLLVLALPLCVFGLYSFNGASDDWRIYQLAQEKNQGTVENARKNRDALILRLQERLKSEPHNTDNWYLLAATAVEVGQFDEGVRAYRRLLAIQPNAPYVLADLAQALFLRAGNTITPEVRANTQAALKMAPNMPTALGLAGIDAYQSGDFKLAMEYWKQAVVQLDPSSLAYEALSGGIARAQDALLKSGVELSEPVASDAGASLTVTVDIDRTKVKVSESDTVFIYARAWQGPKMPLAIRKIKVSELPVTVTLDKSMSMAQGMDL